MYVHQTGSSSRSCLLLMSLVMPTHLKRPWAHQLLKSRRVKRRCFFVRTVTDSLLQCDTKDRIKKKVIDLFFGYEQQKLNVGSHLHALFLPGSPPFQQQQTFTEILSSSSHSSPFYQQQHQHTFHMMQNPNRCDFSPSNASNANSYSNGF